MLRVAFLFLLSAAPALADSLIATRTIRAQTVLATTDMTLVAATIPGAFTSVGEAVGQEARVTLYAGRAIRSGDVGPPAIIDRNQIVTLIYVAGSLSISTEGRAMARGGVGDVIRVMNLASRATISGRIGPDGVVRVGHEN